jgi:hypothetical protein
MQTRGSKIILAILILGLTAIFGLLDWLNRGKFDWTEKFNDQKEQPYDLTVAQRILKSYFSEKKYAESIAKISESLPNLGADKNFIFIGEAINIDSTDIKQLLQFVKTGGTAFISSKTIPIDLMLMLDFDDCEPDTELDYLSENTDKARMRFNDNALNIKELEPFSVVYRNEKVNYDWAVMNPSLFCNDAPDRSQLGTLNDTMINFARWTFGDGQFLFHSNPVVFSNYFLVKKDGQQYAATVFSHLKTGDIFWDKFSRISEATGRRRNSSRGGTPHLGESPLSYILKQQPLAWAWYLLVGLAIAFIGFRGKRRQRIIPIWPKLENTTLDFVKTIGQIAFKNQNHTQLCQQKMRLFLSFLRDRYRFSISRNDPDFARQLSIASKVSQSEIEQIFAHFHTIESNLGDEKVMIALHQSLERFYQNCK